MSACDSALLKQEMSGDRQPQAAVPVDLATLGETDPTIYSCWCVELLQAEAREVSKHQWHTCHVTVIIKKILTPTLSL